MPTKIEWANESWNPIRARLLAEPSRVGWYCEHASEGCRHCYAETMNFAGRSTYTGTRLAYKPGHRSEVEIFLDAEKLLEPLSWRAPKGVFPCSMTDLFGAWVETQWLDRIFAVMGLCPRHTFRPLTKRSDRMRAYLRFPGVADRVFAQMLAISARRGLPMPDKPAWPLRNVWLGVSVEDQRAAERRIPDLRAAPAAVRWLSCEPLIGPLDLSALLYHECPNFEGTIMDPSTGMYECCRRCDFTGIGEELAVDWVVVGGESGGRARPMHPDWARDLREQCLSAGVAFFFKQWGAWLPSIDRTAETGEGSEHWQMTPDGALGSGLPGGTLMSRVGKKKAGRLLDGVVYDAMPEARS